MNDPFAVTVMAKRGRVRIDHVITSLGAGGSETLVFLLARQQARAGHSVGIWTLIEGCHDLTERQIVDQRVASLEKVGVTVTQIGRRSRDVVGSAISLRIALRSCPFGVIHAHSAVTSAAAALASGKRPVVATLHNTNVNFPPRLLRLLRFSIDEYVGVSESVRDAFQHVVGAPILVIENGIDVRDPVRIRATSHEQNVNLLAVGAIRDQKNYLRMIECLALTQKRATALGLHLHLRIAGGLPLPESLLAAAIDRGVRDRIEFLGTRDDVSDLMDFADVFVMSSDFEGLPLALLEAMSAGLACVTTPFKAAFDVLDNGNSGVVAKEFSSASLAEALFSVVSNPELRAQLSARAAARVRHNFSIERCAHRYLDVYQRLLG